MVEYQYPILSYFLQAYWNRNGDLVHGSVRAAAGDFAALEKDEYCDGLVLELGLALDEGLISENMNWETCRGWWSRHDMLIGRRDALEISDILRNRVRRRSEA